MKQTFIVIFFALSLLTQACKRDCHEPEPQAACKIQTHLVQNEGDQPNPPYPKPYQYTRTFGPDGKVNFAELYIIPGNPTGIGIKGTVSHTGNRVLMVNAGDTLLAAALNGHGQPMMLEMGDEADFHPHTLFMFYYDNRNRLSKSTQAFIGDSIVVVTKYQYDQFDNLTGISYADESPYTTFSYDYSRPIKGGDYEVGGMGATIPWEVVVMQLLGHLNTRSPHHLVKEMTTTQYPEGTWSYIDQKVNEEGYLISYRTNQGGGSYYLKGELIWNCNQSGFSKY